MEWYEIVLIILIAAFVAFIFGKMIYDKIKKKPSKECSCCQADLKRSIEEARREVCGIRNRNVKF